MKKIIKYSNYFGIVLAICVMVISGCSCSAPKPTPDPLVGWQKDYTPDPSDQIIEKDYKNYIQTLSPEEKKYLGPYPASFFKDGTGQHAVQITIGINNTVSRHVLIYDKDNKRIKVIKYASGNYAS